MNGHRSVLILGGGINGAAAARELLLNNVAVTLVDRADIAFGATAYSSRLIHGGLRYLEYGEFDLVRESLEERARLLALAPDFVKPLRLHIPIATRWGGVSAATRKLVGAGVPSHRATSRGLHLVQAGLWFYDTFARDRSLDKRATCRIGAPGTPPLNSAQFRWICSYSDAQMCYPERFVIAMLKDAEAIAREKGLRFEVLTYCDATLEGHIVQIVHQRTGTSTECEPSLILNATGAWVDETLRRLQVDAPQLMGGTKGSHFVTRHEGLMAALDGNGVYAEAEDGRPVFLLPFGNGTLVGTTDLRFPDSPENAVATEEELLYLIDAVTHLLPDLDLTREDIAFHYAGVRPLPYATGKSTGAVTRRHSLRLHDNVSVPTMSVIGGKLTTCRALAEETTKRILGLFEDKLIANSRERPIPEHQWAWRHAVDVFDAETIRTLATTEWASTLEDLVERRLMLLHRGDVQTTTLEQLADTLVDLRLIESHEARVPSRDAKGGCSRISGNTSVGE